LIVIQLDVGVYIHEGRKPMDVLLHFLSEYTHRNTFASEHQTTANLIITT